MTKISAEEWLKKEVEKLYSGYETDVNDFGFTVYQKPFKDEDKYRVFQIHNNSICADFTFNIHRLKEFINIAEEYKKRKAEDE